MRGQGLYQLGSGLECQPVQRLQSADSIERSAGQYGGGWKMDGLRPVGRAAGSSIVRRHRERSGKIAGVFKSPQRSEWSVSGVSVESGIGSRLEQPGPEQGAGAFGTSPVWGS